MSQIVIVTDDLHHVAVLNDLDITITRSVSAEVRYMHDVPFSEYVNFHVVGSSIPFRGSDSADLLVIKPVSTFTQLALGEA